MKYKAQSTMTRAGSPDRGEDTLLDCCRCETGQRTQRRFGMDEGIISTRRHVGFVSLREGNGRGVAASTASFSSFEHPARPKRSRTSIVSHDAFSNSRIRVNAI